MNYYILTFDREVGAKYGEFHDDFVGHARITRWFHYIKSSYIIGTSMSADELSDHFYKTAKTHGLPTTHLVMGVKLRDRQGRLTDDAWKWLRRNTEG